MNHARLAPPRGAMLPLFVAALASAAHAQQAYGPWVHDNGAVQNCIYVAPPPTGNDLNSGLTPALAVATLAHALTLADQQLAANFTTGRGVTVNVSPGNYSLPNPLSVPAFGIAVEAYRSFPGSPVLISLTTPTANHGVIEFDRPLGPAAEAAGLRADGLPPSLLRGLTVQNNFAGAGSGVWIDPTLANPAAVQTDIPIAVQVNQCTIVNCQRGIRITNFASLKVPYYCAIVDNEITGFARGIEVLSASRQSDLVRSNRIHGGSEGIVMSSLTLDAGDMHPRILSNAVFDLVDQFGIRLDNLSARIVNNTVAFVSGPFGVGPASIRYAGTGAGETLVIANNILFSPADALGQNADEIQFVPGTFAGTLTITANDFDAAGVFVTPGIPVGVGNVAIASPLFQNGVHLTSLSPSITNVGDQTFVLPGPATTITVGGTTLPANCALDFDLDPRTHNPRASIGEVLHRGADQFIFDGVRLVAPTSSATFPPYQLADSFGTTIPDPFGATSVVLDIAGPAQAICATVFCWTLPMGPELQHAVVPGAGSAAIDLLPANSLVIDLSLLPRQFLFPAGTVVPASLEAEAFVQSLILRGDGSWSFSNRVRLEFDRN